MKIHFINTPLYRHLGGYKVNVKITRSGNDEMTAGKSNTATVR